MRSSLVGPRVMLRRLREVMAEPLSAQERLDKLVMIIAQNMVAEVCSVYMLRADGVLELYATEGLNRAAVHKTGLKTGEGLVGLIAAEARPLNLQDAQTHPAFAYLPETGEEAYHSFLGVPVLRSGRTLGVLVVQNRAAKAYSDEEEEALQTTAMIIAEIVASGDLNKLATSPDGLDLARAIHVQGTPITDGVGLGYAVLHEPRVVVTNLIAENPEAERVRLNKAVSKLRLSVDDMLSRGEVSHQGEHRDVLEAYRMFAYDRGWLHRMEEAILRSGLSAEGAVERVQSDTRARLLRQPDPVLRERLHDFDDLTHRLLRELVGAPMKGDLPKDAILIARNMGAAELLDYNRDHIRGLVLEEGAATSHVAIVSRALGIATVTQAENIVSLVESGDAIIVDGDTGLVHVRPTPEVQQAYAEKVRFKARRQERFRRLRSKPSMTADGVQIGLQMNAGLLFDLPHLDEAGAQGIGLFRTELQFMIASTLPRMEMQADLYSRVLDAAGSRPVTFRTLDVGGDKVLPYLRNTAEENPALGWRSIRLGLDRPALLRTQLRALLRAANGRDLKIMFPMVSEVDEVRRARVLLEKELDHMRRHGRATPAKLQVGTMLEVPSLLFQMDELLNEVDFISVGSNDLFQFMMAVDRGNKAVSERFDPLSPAFLRALKLIAEKGHQHGKAVTLCGEMAGRPLGAMALLGIGYRSISMSPASIGPVKAMLRSLDLSDLSHRLETRLRESGDAHSLRQWLASYAEMRDIPLE